jgi:hypothetical protein
MTKIFIVVAFIALFVSSCTFPSVLAQERPPPSVVAGDIIDGDVDPLSPKEQMMSIYVRVPSSHPHPKIVMSSPRSQNDYFVSGREAVEQSSLTANSAATSHKFRAAVICLIFIGLLCW